MLYTYYKWQIFGWFTQAKARFATLNQPTPQEIANKFNFIEFHPRSVIEK